LKENHTQYFPAFFNLDGQRVLIVGGGEVAKRKLALLMRTGARITLVAPQILPELEAGAARGGALRRAAVVDLLATRADFPAAVLSSTLTVISRGLVEKQAQMRRALVDESSRPALPRSSVTWQETVSMLAYASR
jgi:siroheme synthase-like protein